MTPINRPKQTKDDIYYLALAPNEIITCMKNCHKANEKKNKLHLIILINKESKVFPQCMYKPKSKFIFHLTTPVTPNPPPTPQKKKIKNPPPSLILPHN